MYLHIGQDVVVYERELLGVFDMDKTTVSRTTRDYLARAEKDGRVTYATMDLPKSFVVCVPRGENTAPDAVYIAQPAPSTLRKRAAQKLQFIPRKRDE